MLWVCSEHNQLRLVLEKADHRDCNSYVGSCAVHMINAGVTKEQNATTIEFVGTESVSGYFCRLDDRVSTFCQSPLHYSDLSTGAHRLIVTPLGCTGEKLSVKFEN